MTTMTRTCRYCTDLAVEVIHAPEGCHPACLRHATWLLRGIGSDQTRGIVGGANSATIRHGLHCLTHPRPRAAPIASSAYGASICK